MWMTASNSPFFAGVTTSRDGTQGAQKHWYFPDLVTINYLRRWPSILECCYSGGDIVNRTYGIDENLYIHLFLRSIFGPIYDGPP